MKGGRAKRDILPPEEDPYNSKTNKELARLLLTMKEVEDQIELLKSDLGTLEERYKRLQGKMSIHLLELQQIIVFMMTSSFFIKQLGYVTLLKVWRIYVKEPEDVHFGFPPFLTPQLMHEMNTVIDLEAEDVRKETEANLIQFSAVIESEVGSKMKDILSPNFGRAEDSKEISSALPKHAFGMIRNILLDENQNERNLIESTRKLQRMVIIAVQRQKEMMLNNMLNKRQVQVLEDDRMSAEDLFAENPKSDFVMEESYVDMPIMHGGVHAKKGKGGSGVTLARSVSKMPTLELSQTNKIHGNSQTALSSLTPKLSESSRTELRDGGDGVHTQRERLHTNGSNPSSSNNIHSDKFELKRVNTELMSADR